MFSFLATNKSVTLKTRQIIKGGCQCKHILGYKQFHKFTLPIVSGQHLTKSVVISSASQNASLVPYCYVGCYKKETKKPSLFYSSGYNINTSLKYNNGVNIRYLHVSPALYLAGPTKPSSKVEETVEVLKEKVKAKESPPPTVVPEPPKPVVKKTIKQRIIDEVLHYYHGFRLLFIDIKVSTILVWRVLNGKTLTRREHKLLVRTVGDMFRLVPFSVFIIVPFMELLLPIWIKLFPNMLPSTFQTATEKEDKMKRSLKIKLEMAKFLQQTLDDMAVKGKGHSSQAAKEFAEFFQKVRTSGGMATNEEIMKFSKLFQDEITLDSLNRAQLMALCRVLELQPFGTNNFLRFQLRMKLRSLAADDRMIQKEGIDSLSQSELQQACRARGMRALGMSEERLKAQLSQWLVLSLNEKVPPSLLLLSRAFMLPETTTTTEKLAATISALPDTVGTKTKAVIGEREGKVDNKTKIEVIKEEVARIREERKEVMEEREQLAKIQAKEAKICMDQETLVDKAPVLTDKAPILEPEVKPVAEKVVVAEAVKKPAEKAKGELSTKDFEALEDALDTLGKDKKKMLIEKEELDDLREEMKDYKEDIEHLQQVTKMVDTKAGEIKESVAAQRLYRKVNKMINNMDALLSELEKKEKVMKEDLQKKEKEELKTEDTKKTSDELLKIDELIEAIHKIQKVPDASRLERISEVLGKIDMDKDGVVKVDDVLRVLELIGRENVKLTKKQMDELIDLIGKEDAIKEDLKDEKLADDKILMEAGEKRSDKKDDKSPPKPPPTMVAPSQPPSSSPSSSPVADKKTDSSKVQSSAASNRKPPLTIDGESISPSSIPPTTAPEASNVKASLAPPVTQNIVMEPKDNNNGIPKKL